MNSAIREYILDAVFGAKNFRNEIVWCYKSGAYPSTAFAHKHDTIFRYSRTDRTQFNLVDGVRKILEPNSEKRYNKTDDQGRRYARVKSGGVWREYYLDEVNQPIEDFWIDIPMIKGNYKERIGYPTQKPEALLERIILAST